MDSKKGAQNGKTLDILGIIICSVHCIYFVYASDLVINSLCGPDCLSDSGLMLPQFRMVWMLSGRPSGSQ